MERTQKEEYCQLIIKKKIYRKIMKKLFIALLMVFALTTACHRNNSNTEVGKNDSIEIVVDSVVNDSIANDTIKIEPVMPQFPGGEQAMIDFISENIKYPQEAINNEISGRVLLSFVIKEDGSIGEITVIDSVGGGCDEEATRVVELMPNWTPGMEGETPVICTYLLPIIFKLQ